MRRPAEFKRVYAIGKRLGDEFFTINAQANGLTCARRLIRESFRVNQLRLPALDIVIGVRAGVQTADNARLRSALEKLWQKISATCVNSSAS